MTTPRFLVELNLPPSLRGTSLTELRTDTRLSDYPNVWGARATFRGVPDVEGNVEAELQFLSPEAPVSDLVGTQIVLRRGSTIVAMCSVVSKL